MKSRFTLFFCALIACQFLFAQGVDTLRNITPANWSTELLRPYIGKTVYFDMPIVVSQVNSTSFTVAPWRKYEPLNQGVQGSDEYTNAQHINANLLTLTGASGTHRRGERIYGLTAYVSAVNKLSWKSGTWKGNSRNELQNADIREMVGIPDDCDSCIVVCAFNLENYFTSVGCDLCPSSSAAHQRQRKKIQAALQKINADVYGFCELEKGDAALQEIADDLNKAFPKRNYVYLPEGAVKTTQKSDFLYDANKFEFVRKDQTNVELSDRKKIICLRQIQTGEKFSFSINHFKAMNSGDEYRREKEARAVMNLYNQFRLKPDVRDDDVLFMGDMNAYGRSKPIMHFLNNGFIDLHTEFHADTSYSYFFSNSVSYIDQAICSEAILRQVTGMVAFHINSDEDDAYNFERSSDLTMFRSSDHDPVIIGLRLDSTLSKIYDPYIGNSEIGSDSVTFYYTSPTGHPHMLFDIYSVDGHQIIKPTAINFQGEIGETRTYYYSVAEGNNNLPAQLRQFLPLPSGVYIIRFYYNGIVKAHKLIVR